MKIMFNFKVFFFFFSILLLLFSLKKIYGKEINLDRPFDTINIRKDEIVNIKIPGKGWFVNRYSDEKIDILLRILDDNCTIFKIKGIENGEGYIFFSHVKMDRYVRIVVNNNVRNGVKSKVTTEEITSDSKNKENSFGSITIPNNNASENNKDKKIIKENEERELQKNKIKKDNISKSDLEKVKNNSTPINSRDKDYVKVSLNNNQKMGKVKNNMQKEKAKKSEKKETLLASTKKSKPVTNMYFYDKSGKKITVALNSENEKFFKGKKAFKNGNYEKSIDLLKDYIKDCKDCIHKTEALYILANIYSVINNTKLATEYYKRLINCENLEYRYKALLFLGDYETENRNYNEALRYLVKAFELKKDFNLAKKIGDINFETGNLDESIKYYKFCIDSIGGDDYIYYKLASIYDSDGKYKDIQNAYKYYRLIVKRFPSSRYYNIAEERVKFFEKNFINFK